MAGVFNRPFGHEIGYSTSGLESPERATIIQYFFPDERDLGAMLTLRTKKESPLAFLRLDAGLFAGNSINRETDNRKDFIGRLGADKEIGNWGKWGAGISYYNGGVYNPTTTAYEMDGKRFIEVDKGETGTYMKREYIGMDAQFSFLSSWGTTSLRAEGLLGTQPGIASSSKVRIPEHVRRIFPKTRYSNAPLSVISSTWYRTSGLLHSLPYSNMMYTIRIRS